MASGWQARRKGRSSFRRDLGVGSSDADVVDVEWRRRVEMAAASRGDGGVADTALAVEGRRRRGGDRPCFDATVGIVAAVEYEVAALAAAMPRWGLRKEACCEERKRLPSGMVGKRAVDRRLSRLSWRVPRLGPFAMGRERLAWDARNRRIGMFEKWLRSNACFLEMAESV